LSEKIVSLGRETQKKFLEFCIEMFRQALLINYETKSLVYFEPKVDKFKLENFAPFVNGNNIHDIFKELSDAMYHVERNGNAKIILTDLSIKLTRLIHKNNSMNNVASILILVLAISFNLVTISCFTGKIMEWLKITLLKRI
jgi:hypothetical protein